MRIALVQRQAAGADPGENLRRGIEACAEAAQMGADLILFPELWQIGYAGCSDESDKVEPSWILAIKDSDSWLDEFAKAAKTHEIAVVPTYLREERLGADAAAVTDRSGELLSVYRTVHLCKSTWERPLIAGSSLEAVDVDTAAGPLRLGVMICYDREFPEAAPVLALDGAELILCPNAYLLCDDQIAQVRVRAFENAAAAAVANYPLPGMNGRSCIFDGRNGTARQPRAGDLGAVHRRPDAYRTLAAS
jgi:predicted amidohydrolase